MVRALLCALALGAASAAAVESTQWPPPPEVLARMHELQSAMGDPSKSNAERAAARAELQRLMKSPAGAQRIEEAKKPARAAIDPFPSVAKEMEGRMPNLTPKEAPPTARLEVIEPPRRPTIDPATGSLIQPTAPGTAIDTRTGRLLQETPGGYVDPRTGRLIPK